MRAAELMVREAAALYEAGKDCGAEANMAKHLAAEASWAAADMCLQTHGGFGFAEEFDIERKFRETRLYTVAPISTNLVLSYIAEHVLGTAEVVLNQPLPLSGLLVVSLEQAVAAPMCTCRLADAGARVIKIERPEGDFARGYDDLVHGECSYFVWLNRGKESVVLDLDKRADKALLAAMLARADVFVQNLKPGAVGKLGFAIAKLRRKHPRLICCSISGFGESGPLAKRKAYDMLIQAESGLASITGTSEPSRVGVSVVDIASGMNAYEAILEALIARERTGEGAELSISMFDAMADWMTVPLLAAGGRRAAAAHRPRPYFDLALRRIQEPRRRRYSDFHPERPRMARAGGKGLGRRRARGRSGLRHQCRARQTPRRNRRQGRQDLRRARRRGARAKARRRRHRLRPRQRPGGSGAPSASAPHHRRHAERAGVLSGAGRTAARRRGITGRCRRSASTPRRCARNSWRLQ